MAAKASCEGLSPAAGRAEIMAHPDVIQMLKESLKAKGYDGLQCDGECGCDIDDLAPCTEGIQAHCEAGYKVHAPLGSGASYDWYICHSKNDRPWE